MKYNAVDVAGNVSTTKTSSFAVRKITSATTLKASAGGQSYGTTKPVTVTATVKLGTGAAPAGQVRFRDGAKVLGSTSLAGGKAALTLSRTLKVGAHSITAEFVPSDKTTTAGSTSGAVKVRVSKAVSKTALKAAKSSVKAGKPVVFTATVTLDTKQAAAGSVRFTLDGKTVKSAKVSGGKAAYSMPGSTKVGTHRVVATFVPTSPGTVARSISKTVTVKVVR